MPDDVITEGANAINTLTISAPVLGALAIVVVILGVVILMMQRSHNLFVFKVLKQQEEQLDKVIEFVSNFAAMMQSDRDTTQALTKVVSELNRDCRLRFDKDCDDSG